MNWRSIVTGTSQSVYRYRTDIVWYMWDLYFVDIGSTSLQLKIVVNREKLTATGFQNACHIVKP
jgi:hypothetical protein